MGIADELAELKRLLDEGALTDEEFETAKRRVLAGDRAQAPAEVFGEDLTVGRAANRYVNLQIATSVLAAILMGFGLLYGCSVWSATNSQMDEMRGFPSYRFITPNAP